MVSRRRADDGQLPADKDEQLILTATEYRPQPEMPSIRKRLSKTYQPMQPNERRGCQRPPR